MADMTNRRGNATFSGNYVEEAVVRDEVDSKSSTKRGNTSSNSSSPVEEEHVAKELISLVVSAGRRPLAPSKAELQFGHHITQSIYGALLLISMAVNLFGAFFCRDPRTSL
jgi:hypothetical protein